MNAYCVQLQREKGFFHIVYGFALCFPSKEGVLKETKNTEIFSTGLWTPPTVHCSGGPSKAHP